MNSPLTLRQQQIFNFVSTEILQRHRAPTRAEIAQHFGFRSANAAEEHLRNLARRGVVVLDRYTARGIRLTGLTAHPSKCSKCNTLRRLLVACRDAMPNTNLADRINDELDLWDVPGEAPAHRCALRPTGDHATAVATRSVTALAGSAVGTITTASLEGSEVNPSRVMVKTS